MSEESQQTNGEVEERDPKDNDDLMFQIYIGMGAIGLAFVLLIVILLLKKKFCPEPTSDKDKELQLGTQEE